MILSACLLAQAGYRVGIQQHCLGFQPAHMPPSSVNKLLFDLPSPAIFPHKAPKKSRTEKESPSFYTVVLSPDGVPEESIHYCKWVQLKVGDGVILKRSEKLEEAAGYWADQRPSELPIFIYYEPHSSKGYSFELIRVAC